MLRTFFEGLISQGVKLKVEKSDIAVDGDSAVATVVYSSNRGQGSTSKMTMRKEADGVWRFISTERAK